ncbi:MAG TPA: transcriptional regulator, partial [Nitrosopumilaceae archaeon]|nr:transcriptional regulator [Nitrosopumilaceae archaeon]
KLERQNMIKREKVLENGRWTYKLKIAHAPVTTESIEAAPCLICPVESKCTLEGEISPRTCPLIEQWVITEFINIKKPKK